MGSLVDFIELQMAKDWRWAWLPCPKKKHWLLRDWLPMDTTSWSRVECLRTLATYFYTSKRSKLLTKSQCPMCWTQLCRDQKSRSFSCTKRRWVISKKGQPWWFKLDFVSHATIYLVLVSIKNSTSKNIRISNFLYTFFPQKRSEYVEFHSDLEDPPGAFAMNPDSETLESKTSFCT